MGRTPEGSETGCLEDQLEALVVVQEEADEGLNRGRDSGVGKGTGLLCVGAPGVSNGK